MLILGCGPAGLFAAQAAKNAGADYRILSRRRQSELYGAQYLQAPIPGLVEYSEKFMVHFELQGSFLDYKRKVYGDELPDPDAVPEDEFFHDKPGWDIREAYKRAWETHQHLIENWTLSAEALIQHLAVYKPHLVVSTIPLPAICGARGAHAFTGQSLWAIGDAPERGVAVPFAPQGDNTVLYNGTSDTGWHRCARIQGYGTIEWPEGNRPPVEDVAKISKPVATSCNCWERRGFVKAGRYGAWNWAGQSHHGYVLTEVLLK